jgi:hypothetical protein
MNHHCDLSQSRGAYRCGDGDRPATSEKKVPQRPVSDGDKGADTLTPPVVPAISTPGVEKDKKANDQSPSADGEIWPKGPADTD